MLVMEEVGRATDTRLSLDLSFAEIFVHQCGYYGAEFPSCMRSDDSIWSLRHEDCY